MESKERKPSLARSKWRYWPRKSIVPIVAVAAGLVLTVLVNGGISSSRGVSSFWTNWCDPFVTAVTLIAAVGTWFQARNTEWEENLPERLTVHLKYKGKYVYTCWEAPLTSESDIRQWGQQIGKQMNYSQYLEFKPDILISGPMFLGQDGDTSDPLRRVWEMTAILHGEPMIDKPKSPEYGKYKVWYPSILKEATNQQPRVAEEYFGERPDEHDKVSEIRKGLKGYKVMV